LVQNDSQTALSGASAPATGKPFRKVRPAGAVDDSVSVKANEMSITSRELLPELSATDIEALGVTMDASGFAVLRNVVQASLLAEAEPYIKRELQKHDNQYFGLAGRDWIEASPLAELGRSPEFRRILATLWEHSMRRAAPVCDVAPSIRVLSGTIGLRHSGRFHYDSYVVTALVPLMIPNGPDEPAGDLIMYPNLRHARSNALVNIVEKIVTENAWACRIWCSALVQRWLHAKVIPMQPGNIYFFWGMRSLHANQACLPHSIRCTALFHFGDPHAGGLLKRLSGQRHQARLRRLSRMPAASSGQQPH
jgi:hypothetical protein